MSNLQFPCKWCGDTLRVTGSLIESHYCDVDHSTGEHISYVAEQIRVLNGLPSAQERLEAMRTLAAEVRAEVAERKGRTMTVAEFLLVRIAEDEDLARKAARGGDGRWHRGYADDSLDGRIPDYDECRIEGDTMVIYDEGGHDPEQAEYIATHDPARFLAECAAKRAIIELAQKASEDEKEYDDYEWQGTVKRIEPLTGDAILFALAAVYKDHPDYQQEWAA